VLVILGNRDLAPAAAPAENRVPMELENQKLLCPVLPMVRLLVEMVVAEVHLGFRLLVGSVVTLIQVLLDLLAVVQLVVFRLVVLPVN